LPERIAVVAALITERPMCMECICAKADLEPARVDALLMRLERVLKVHRLAKARCRACGENRATFSIDQVP